MLDPERAPYTLRDDVLAIKAILLEAGGIRIEPDSDISSGETITEHGVAISPTMAAMCMDDFVRTVQFIRGVHAAVSAQPDKKPVRILYAGCGPLAPLAIPLMTVLAADEVRFTLLDIHQKSIDSVKSIVRTFGLADHVDEILVGDAATHKINDTTRPDVIVVEMLRAALEAEPQFDVCANLLSQAPDAVLVPEDVQLELALINTAREFSFIEKDQEPELERDRLDLGSLLGLSKESILAFASNGIKLEQVRTPATIPEYDPSRYDPMIRTTIRTYGEYVLSDYESGITCPRPLPVKVSPDDTIEIAYARNGRPGIFVIRNSER